MTQEKQRYEELYEAHEALHEAKEQLGDIRRTLSPFASPKNMREGVIARSLINLTCTVERIVETVGTLRSVLAAVEQETDDSS